MVNCLLFGLVMSYDFGFMQFLLSVASRRNSEELIFEGRVTVNGSVCNTPQVTHSSMCFIFLAAFVKVITINGIYPATCGS